MFADLVHWFWSIQESIIYSIAGDADWDHMPDLILTEDVTGVNAGQFSDSNV